MRSRGLCVFVLLIVAAASGNGFAAASTPLPCGVYTGTIGAYAVVAEFCVAIPTRGGPALPGTVSGSYYYRKAGVSIDLTDQQITLGRANDATLVVNDDYASTHHARIFPQDGQWIVEDLGSTNGTYLDRQKVIRPTPVPVGVPIRIGKTVLELRR